MDDLLTVAQAAEQLGLTPSQVRRYIAAGRLPAERAGERLYLVQVAALAALERPRRGRPRKHPDGGDGDGHTQTATQMPATAQRGQPR